MKTIIKWIAIVFGGLVAFVAVLAFFGESLATAYLGAPKAFSAEKTPARLDYTSLDSWAAHPDTSDPTDLHKANETPPEDAAHPVDVFYVHPTTYFGPGEWNAIADDSNFAGQLLEPILAVHGSVFRDCCDVYSPHYRQAHIGSFIRHGSPASFAALDLAFFDVDAAFDEFLSQRHADRPFIIAGHSQGSLHAIRLIETRIQGTDLQDHMIAAYPIGYWVPADKLTRGLGPTGLCQTADQTGCLVTYDSYGDLGPGRDLSGQIPYWYASGWEWVSPQTTLCVNPLSWEANTETVSADANKGALTTDSVFSLISLLRDRNDGITFDALPDSVPALTGAHCDANGTLFVEGQTEGPFSVSMDQKTHMYHSYDWSLFYENLKENVENRIVKFAG